MCPSCGTRRERIGWIESCQAGDTHGRTCGPGGATCTPRGPCTSRRKDKPRVTSSCRREGSHDGISADGWRVRSEDAPMRRRVCPQRRTQLRVRSAREVRRPRRGGYPHPHKQRNHLRLSAESAANSDGSGSGRPHTHCPPAEPLIRRCPPASRAVADPSLERNGR